jgi:hypothetical protein
MYSCQNRRKQSPVAGFGAFLPQSVTVCSIATFSTSTAMLLDWVMYTIRSLPAVPLLLALQTGRPLIFGFGERFEIQPVGSYGTRLTQEN